MPSDFHPDLNDARALLDRAKRHYFEFHELMHPKNGQGLWQTSVSRDPLTDEWCYCLGMDRQRLITAKPIIADSATNVVSALDHVVAAIAKVNKHDRSRSLYFPMGLTERAFGIALAKVTPVLGDQMARVLAAVRAKHILEVEHVEAAKQISNTGKHWQLMVPTSLAHAVAIHVPGSAQRFFDIPRYAFSDADIYEFWRNAEQLPRVPISILIGYEISGLDGALPKSPDSIFSCSFRFVESVIEAVTEAGV